MEKLGESEDQVEELPDELVLANKAADTEESFKEIEVPVHSLFFFFRQKRVNLIHIR